MGDVQTDSFMSQIDWYPNLIGGDAISPNATRHQNSTIITHAFYLMAQGGYHARAGNAQNPPTNNDPIPSLFVAAVPGGFVTARNIIVRASRSPALTNPGVGGQVTFQMFRDAAENEAITSYGPVAGDSVHRAFQAVGMGASCGPHAPIMPVLNLINEYCFGRWTMTWAHVPYATWYEVKAYPWTLGWNYAQLISGGYRTECSTQVGTTYGVRMRACNSCGCSDWTASQGMTPSNTCQ